MKIIVVIFITSIREQADNNIIPEVIIKTFESTLRFVKAIAWMIQATIQAINMYNLKKEQVLSG